jgi:hypothetical protein
MGGSSLLRISRTKVGRWPLGHDPVTETDARPHAVLIDEFNARP